MATELSSGFSRKQIHMLPLRLRGSYCNSFLRAKDHLAEANILGLLEKSPFRHPRGCRNLNVGQRGLIFGAGDHCHARRLKLHINMCSYADGRRPIGSTSKVPSWLATRAGGGRSNARDGSNTSPLVGLHPSSAGQGKYTQGVEGANHCDLLPPSVSLHFGVCFVLTHGLNRKAQRYGMKDATNHLHIIQRWRVAIFCVSRFLGRMAKHAASYHVYLACWPLPSFSRHQCRRWKRPWEAHRCC